MNATVNYDSFWTGLEIADQYLDLEWYVEERDYLKGSRYTTTGFTRIKLSQSFGNRSITADIVQNYVGA
ncbi:MAG: hypothetical protein OSB69_16600 [Alphaproteobacteria bacterium]|nr:hypothetical protein [Alphaproteobacteria bacterium]